MNASQLSPDDIRAAAQAHQELGSEYRDAVVESFLEKMDHEIAARIDARISGLPQARRRQLDPATEARRRTLIAGVAIGALGAGVPLTLFGHHLAVMTGASQGVLAVIWILVAVILVVAGIGTGVIRAPQPPGKPEPRQR